MEYKEFLQNKLKELTDSTPKTPYESLENRIAKNKFITPIQRDKQLCDLYKLTQKEVVVINTDLDTVDLFMYLCTKVNPNIVIKQFLGFWTNIAKKQNCKISGLKLSVDHFIQIASMVDESKISPQNAAIIAEKCLASKEMPMQIAEKYNLFIENRSDLPNIITQVISENPEAIADFKGKKGDKIKPFLLGKIMKITKGKVDSNLVKIMLDKALEVL